MRNVSRINNMNIAKSMILAKVRLVVTLRIKVVSGIPAVPMPKYAIINNFGFVFRQFLALLVWKRLS